MLQLLFDRSIIFLYSIEEEIACSVCTGQIEKSIHELKCVQLNNGCFNSIFGNLVFCIETY